ncbi:MAG: MBOAT family protein [Oscillospiraceae bacterium]|jgi:D-alanyl-lipoteichoic acid acyltransferase DltB (MBOAT superfamily)|nr:MBOAT family protein [Oscillospiraceae bacterium]
MSLTSLAFVGFLILVIIAYYIVPQRLRWIVLLIASAAFYALCGVFAFACLIFVAATTYCAGLWLGRLNASEQPRDTIRKRRKLIVLAAVVLNFGLLFALKYLDSALGLASRIFRFGAPHLGILAPLGVSFYIFQSVGYVVDCCRGKYAPERNFAKYLLFCSFFPQIVQGPIGRYDELAPQLTRGNALDFANVRDGVQLAMWGYFKKLVIAERAGVIVASLFSDVTAHGGAVTAFSMVMYCVQLYCDFSGGIDIARGAAKMLGVDMAENFARPIMAVSLADYWRRWHMTLGTWMRDYLFYPLSLSKPLARLGKAARKRIGGKLGKILPTSIATFVVYLAVGAWHGAHAKYIVYGLYNAVIITSSLLLDGVYANARRTMHIRDDSGVLKLFRIVRTCAIIFIGRYITRANGLSQTLYLLKKTVAHFDPRALFNGTLATLGLPISGIVTVLVGIAVVVVVEVLQERGLRVRESLARRGAFTQWLAVAVPFAVILIFGIVDQGFTPAEFIYAQF